MPYQRKDGRWRAHKMINGIRHSPTFNTKKEALAWESGQTEEKWKVSETIPTVCLHEVATAYLEYSEARHHEETFKAKQRALKRLFAQVGKDAKPEHITAGVALKYHMEKAKEESNAAANKYRKHLSAFWEYGKKYYKPHFPKDNPFMDVERLPENSQPHYVPPEDDFWKVYAVATDDTDRLYLLSYIHTGGRRSEPIRWDWDEDINMREKRIRLSTCKTKDGSRKYEWVSMSNALHAALVAHREKTGGQGRVFTSKTTGEPYVTRKHFVSRLCEKAGVKRFNYHGIRGLLATILAADGVSRKDIQVILMHSSLNVTDTYIRKVVGSEDRLGASLDRIGQKKTASKVLAFKAA